METATVFNIQKFSLDDGPGIRTTVFLKGCPLRCYWCANPESQIREPQLEWNHKKCTGCSTCCTICPTPPRSTFEGKTHIDIRHVSLTDEGVLDAAQACPARALTRVGATKTTDEVFEACMKDEPFYRQSGGGVTLSGGEPLLWPEFCIELLEKLRDAHIDTNIETAAFIDPEIFSRVTHLLTHAYIDMKHGDPRAHRNGTGISNERILTNTKRAISEGVDVLVRTPIIPGFNDTAAAARAMAHRLHDVGTTKVQLLPFHNYGENKYDLLEREYRLRGHATMHPEDLENLCQVYAHEGINAFV